MAVAGSHAREEYFDVLTKTGQKTGLTKARGDVHRDGDYHRAVHVWIFAESTQELLLQRRADCKDSWPGLWDISSAGHISAGDSSLITARRELEEELGIALPADAFEMIFIYLQECVINDGKFINNEFNDVYLVTTIDPIPLEAFTLQKSEVSSVKYISYNEYRTLLANEDPEYVPYEVSGKYGQLFDIIEQRYKVNTTTARSLAIKKQLDRYATVSLDAKLTGLKAEDKEALVFLVKAAKVMDEIFYRQVWNSNVDLRDWLKSNAEQSQLDQLKWAYYLINKSPWSSLDENKAFLTTTDSAIKVLPESTSPVPGWKGLQYRAAFPMLKPPGANFYPPDMDKKEFELWKGSLSKEQQDDATGFFSIVKRLSESNLNSSLSNTPLDGINTAASFDLYTIPFSQAYRPLLTEAAELLHKAADVTSSPSLKRLLQSKASAFLSNDYYDSDIAWMELDSELDITIGPYETYEDGLFGYKATFEAFIGVRDDKATAELKLFGDNLQVLEQNLPMDNVYKSKDVQAAPIRVIQLLYNAGMMTAIGLTEGTQGVKYLICTRNESNKSQFDLVKLNAHQKLLNAKKPCSLEDVKGPQTVAFNLPNDERIVNDRGTSMIMLKNVSEAKFNHILQSIASVCISKEQQQLVDFESFFTHTVCHECCHGIGPHTITLPNGQTSTVRMELQELHSALEEAKADIVGLWAVKFLIDQKLLPNTLLESMYVSFLAGCFRSVRFGLEEAHGKGQAVQFNWLYEKEAFLYNAEDDTFSVDFSKVEEAVESLSREILTIQAKGDKEAAKFLLDKYCVMTPPLLAALQKLEKIQVPVDIAPVFPIADEILGRSS